MTVIVTAQDKTVKSPSEGYIWGTDADTIMASDTLEYVFKLQSGTVMDLRFMLTTTKTSGTVTEAFIFAGSVTGDDGSYESIDTITNTDAATNIQHLNIDDFNYEYLRVRAITGATAQLASFRLDYLIRNE